MAITTGKARASYVQIFQPQAAGDGGDPKYSMTLLIPKTDIATINRIYAEIERAKQEGAQKVFGGVVPAQCRIPINDGDGCRPSGEPFGEECKGHMVLKTSAKWQPVIVNLDMQNIINPAEVYSGCYVRANIYFTAYNTNGNKGISCRLNAVQKVGDGEPFSIRVSAEEAFGGVNTYTEVLQYQQPAPGAVPGGTPYQQPAPGTVPGGIPYQQPAPGFVPGGSPYQQPAPGAMPGGIPYQQPVPGSVPGNQQYQQPACDPITGRPYASGGVMGL